MCCFPTKMMSHPDVWLLLVKQLFECAKCDIAFVDKVNFKLIIDLNN